MCVMSVCSYLTEQWLWEGERFWGKLQQSGAKSLAVLESPQWAVFHSQRCWCWSTYFTHLSTSDGPQPPPREVCLHLSESVWKRTKRIYTLLALILQSMFVECACFWPVQYMSRDQAQYDLKLEAQTHRKRLTHMFWSTSIILNGCTHTESVMRCVKLPWRLVFRFWRIKLRTQRVWRELQEIKKDEVRERQRGQLSSARRCTSWRHAAVKRLISKDQIQLFRILI